MRIGTATAGVLAASAVLLAATPTLAAASSPPTAPLCATSQLTGSLSGSNAGAGSLFVNLVLTNKSGSACHVKGYPGLSVLDAGGNQIGPAATYVTGQTAGTIVLQPGESASDTIHTGLGTGTGFCEPASTSVRVYPPGDTAALLITPGVLKACDHVFAVTPLAPGTDGNPEGSAGIVTTPTPTSISTASAVPASGTATSAPTAAAQVPVVPSGAPDTGVAPIAATTSHDTTTVLAASAGAAVLAGAFGVGFAVRRRSRARG